MRIYTVLFLLLTSSISHALTVPIIITERASVAREAHVTYGVPFSRVENVVDVESLGILGEDAQFRVTSRYGGAVAEITQPIRTVLVDFQPTLTSGQIANFELTTGGTGTVSGTDICSDGGGYLRATTGAATFDIHKTNTGLFGDVWIGATQVIDSPTTDGLIINYSSIDYISTPSNVIIEENGPLRCVIKKIGAFSLTPPTASDGVSPDSPLRSTIRYEFYKNR